jgi:hypothetical protein
LVVGDLVVLGGRRPELRRRRKRVVMKPKKRNRQIAEERSGVTTSEVMSEGRALQYGIQIVRSGSKKLQAKLHLHLASIYLGRAFLS